MISSSRNVRGGPPYIQDTTHLISCDLLLPTDHDLFSQSPFVIVHSPLAIVFARLLKRLGFGHKPITNNIHVHLYLLINIHEVPFHAHPRHNTHTHVHTHHRQAAVDGQDYAPISGQLVFDEGVTSQSFNLSLLQDTSPEIDEYVFIAITEVQLNESSLDAVDTGALPFIAPGNDSVAFIVISENDDARGVVQFSQSAVETPEPSQDFISITREAGTFGEVGGSWVWSTLLHCYKLMTISTLILYL